MGDSLLIAETTSMERKRRLAEQQGHRQFAPVKARDHSDEELQNNNPEGDLQNTILQQKNYCNPERSANVLTSVLIFLKCLWNIKENEAECLKCGNFILASLKHCQMHQNFATI